MIDLTKFHHDDGTPFLGKLAIVWVTTITGLTVTEWAAVFACIYTLLQIYVLLRDKVFRPRWRRKGDPE